MLRLFVAALLARPAAAADKAGIEWVSLPGGHFAMGSERWPDAKPVHQVAVKPFQIAKSPVTNRQYRACVAAGACAVASVKCATSAFMGDDQPVVCVDWEQAAAFSRWAGLPPRTLKMEPPPGTPGRGLFWTLRQLY